MCKLGTNVKMVEVYTDDSIFVLKQKLNLDKERKFVFKGISYSINSVFTFEEIGIKENNIKINFVTQARAGWNNILFL